MQILCIGDVAISEEDLSRDVWIPPGGIIPGGEARVLFNWELPIGRSINPVPRQRGRRILAHPHCPA